MKDPFAIFRNKCSAAIAAMTLGVLLLLPASLGLGGTFVGEAFGQFNLPSIPGQEDTTTTPSPPEEDTTPSPPPPPEEDTTPSPPPQTTSPPPQGTENGLTFLERGFIGSTLPTQGGSTDNTHVITGRFRVYANDSLIQRFVAEMNLAAIDGSSFNNITIEETEPHRFELTQGANGTTAAAGPIPPVSSNIMTRIYVNSNIPIIDDVPMTISIRGQALAVDGITVDEARVTDTAARNILSIIDGQSIYGTIPR
jgi:hypothetical protein